MHFNKQEVNLFNIQLHFGVWAHVKNCTVWDQIFYTNLEFDLKLENFQVLRKYSVDA